jgi:hypothetical protein
MAGYSGTPLLKKLGVKDGHRVLLCKAPEALPEELIEFRRSRPGKDLDVAVLFATSFAAFQEDFAALTKSVKPDGMIWVAWPKKASGVRTDVTENMIREHSLKTVFVDIKVCAIDKTWSGLKLVVRKEHRNAFAANQLRI